MHRLLLLSWAILLSTGVLIAQTVTGTVTDDEGTPLIGASIFAKGTTSGTVTDIDGNYSFNPPANTELIVVTYTGFEPQEVSIDGRSQIDVVLLESSTTLDQVVVTGYGTQTRRRLTTSIASVDAAALENVPTTTFEGALQGRLPGVTITGNAGTLGAQTSIRIRGIGSINSDNQPLFVVDGVIINSSLGGADLGGPGTSPLVNINPNDIATIDVLKDAASASIYGSRGSNGVIIITTKSGQFNQKASVTINQQAGITRPTNTFDLLTGPQYANLWNQALDARTRITGTDLGDFGFRYDDPDAEPSTDWQDLVLRNGSFSETSANVGGGTERLAYYIGGTFRDEKGYVLGTDLQRYSLRLNLEQKLGDKWRVGLNVNPTRTVNSRQNEDNNVASPLTYSALAFPNIAAFDEEGNTRGGLLSTSNGQNAFAGTPLINIEGQNISLTQNQVIGKAFVEFQPIAGLKLRSSFGAQSLTARDNQKSSSLTTDGNGSRGTVSANYQEVLNYTWDNTASYFMEFDRSDLDLTFAFSMQDEQFTSLNVDGNNFADDRLLTLNSAAEITGGGGFNTQFRFVGYLLAAQYSFNNQLFVRGSARIDGSSRFGSDNLYGFFPAISAAYDLAPSFVNGPFSQLKLRASYGLTGNAGIGNFVSRGLVGFGTDYNMIPGGTISSLPNSDLTWETATTADVALDFELGSGFLSGSIGYYNKESSDLLLEVPQPQTNGINDITLNAGRLRNQGIEFGLDFNILRSDDLSLTFNINGATVSNEVLELTDNDGDGEPDDIINGRQLIRVGEALGSWFLVPYAGVDSETGDALFTNTEGEETSAYPGGNRLIFGNPLPDFTGGFGSRLNFRGIDFSFQFQAALGHQLYRNEARFTETNLSSVFNQVTSQLDSWTPENNNASVPEARLFIGNGNQHSTRYLTDADYLRLRNVQLGYTFQDLGGSDSSLRVFLSGQNLLTFTNFTGLDPEANGADNNSYQSGELFFSRPQSEIYSVGINLNL